MRCTNCGWDNPSDQVKCIKCNSNLVEAVSGQKAAVEPSIEKNDLKGTIKGGIANAEPLDKKNVAGTIKGGSSDAAPWGQADKSNTHEDSAKTRVMINCNNCGYPVAHGADKCPKCGTAIEVSAGEDVIKKTINPYSKSKTNICYLNLLPRENEKEVKKIEFEGNYFDISRANIEPENESISRNVHAHFEFRDGDWYISNPDDKVTFVKVTSETKINAGDIILLGDRMVQFENN